MNRNAIKTGIIVGISAAVAFAGLQAITGSTDADVATLTEPNPSMSAAPLDIPAPAPAPSETVAPAPAPAPAPSDVPAAVIPSEGVGTAVTVCAEGYTLAEDFSCVPNTFYDVPAYPSVYLPECAEEDSTDCYWNAATRGNGVGSSFVNIGGTTYYFG